MRRVLFVGRTRYRLPLDDALAQKWDALGRRLDVRVLASGTGSDPRFELVAPRRLDGPRFYLSLTARVARELRSFDPDVVVAESPYEGVAVRLARRLTRSRARVILELHGDWRVSTRLYGSRLRSLVAPLGDLVTTRALRRADGVRAISAFTAGLARSFGQEPVGVFATYSDLAAFDGDVVPLPDAPRAIFVGVLERYKNVDGLARAWSIVRRELPEAQLHLVSSGTQRDLAEQLRAAGATWDERLAPSAVARAIDDARVLLLPSRAEGLGRVVIEAFLRGRPVVGANVGGIPDLVLHEENGLLVDPDDDAGIADAILRILRDDELARRLGAGARATAEEWRVSADEYADRYAEAVERVLR